MGRVLLASTVNWLSPARVPGMLAEQGISSDVLDIGDTFVAASSHVAHRAALVGDLDGIARESVRRAADYDRVILCNEHLIGRILRLHGEEADHMLPASRDALEALLNKTRFPAFARQHGLPVADSEVAHSPWAASQAAGRLGGEGRVVVKGSWGAGGSAVRIPDTYAGVRQAAEELGCPVLVERRITGRLINVPALHDRGRLVAMIPSRKAKLEFPNGPSAVNEFFVPDAALRTLAETYGEAFGLHGFSSADVFLTPDGELVLLEINPRPVAQLHLGARVGVDMGRAFAEVLQGRWDGRVLVPSRPATVHLFPQDLRRYYGRWGRSVGLLRWARHARSWSDVPWRDAGLLAYECASLQRPRVAQPVPSTEGVSP